MLKSDKPVEDGMMEPIEAEITSASTGMMEPVKAEITSTSQEKKTAPISSSSDQDLDVFLLGDLGDSDEGPGMVQQFVDVCSVLMISAKTCLHKIFKIFRV